MMKPGALILVCMLQTKQLRFRRKRLNWPLHVTLVPWFSVDDEAVFLGELKKSVRTIPAFDVQAGDDALFGPNEDIPVSLIKQQAVMQELHWELYLFAAMNSATPLEKRWCGNEYLAHSTHHGDDRLQKGDKVAIDNITVVRLLADDFCEVIQTFSLQGAL